MITFLTKKSKKEIWQFIIKPFTFSRLLLLVIAWFSQYFQPSNQYFSTNNTASQFAFSSFRFLDVWGRWDSGWYLNIAQHGYLGTNALSANNSLASFAFFPLYPSLIKVCSFLVPKSWLNQEVYLLIAVILANLFFLLALITLFYLLRDALSNYKVRSAQTIAKRSIIFLLFFPTSFIFSCAYTESLFLLLSLLTFMNLQKNKYLLANLSAALASLTRPYGILLLLPIVSTYWQKKHCALKNWIALTLPLFALAGYMYYCYTQTGDSLLFLHSQTVWHKQFSWPWQSLWQPIHFIGYITPVEKLLSLLALLVLLIAFKFLPTPWVIWANLLNLIPLLSGTIISNARYMLLLWPLFVTLAIISLHKKSWYETSLAILLVLQTLLFSAWCQFYWVA